jgi:diguanylate cyclase (GGDEF)-like protein
MPTRVMIVEDERIFARDMQQQLRGLGYDVCASAASSAEALSLADEHRPEVVLMDVRIKGPHDGVATAEMLRERLDAPVIFITAHADDATLTRAKLTGPQGYLLKPIKPGELKSTIEIALFKHTAERQLREANDALRKERDRSATLLAQLQAAVAHLTCGVAVTDSEGKLVVINDAMLQIFRSSLAPEAAVGRSAFEVIFRGGSPMEDNAAFRQRIVDIAREAKPVSGDRVSFRDGRTYERDFVPAVLGHDAVGHVWCYYDVTSSERQRELLVQQVHRDPLTGIANRLGFEIMLGRRLSQAEPFALLFIDLDGFKGVNDNLGHEVGDAVLREAAARLRTTLRGSDDVARFAGDEFVGLASMVTSAVVEAVMAKVHKALSFEGVSDKGRAPVSASIGVALFPDDGRDARSLLTKADERMYAAKARRKPGGGS